MLDNTFIKYLAVALFFFSLTIFSACEDTVETDTELIPYFDLFAAEAAKRGITVDYVAERIEGSIRQIDDESVLGQCFRNEEKPKKVVVDTEYWADASESEKEFLIFHELGHCFLNRDHDDSFDGDGTCLSIMHSTPQACTFELTEENKEAYLDELFEQ